MMEGEEEDRGELRYQESKEFNSEWFLCNAYDNTKTKKVLFEIYGLDTQDMYTKKWDYAAFDGLFRFNAELMNPNRKEGRFHYIIERLSIETVAKGNGEQVRELKLMPEPSEEVPQLPICETTRKIPTGRMDLKERQRLREQMDMLDIRRSENIANKQLATRQRILAHIMKLKEEDAKKKANVDQKLEEERKLRYKMREEQDRKDRENELKMEAMKKARRKAVEVKEERTEEQDEEEYRQLRARWRVRDAEKAKIIADLKAKTQKNHQEAREAAKLHEKKMGEVQSRREAAWAAKADRVKRKEAARLKAILEVKKERDRHAKLRQERNNEYLQALFSERQPKFAAQLERTEERKLAAEAEAHALENYQEKRAIPKKVNKKRKSKKDAEGGDAKAKGKAKAKSKAADSEAEGASAEEPAPVVKAPDAGKVLDSVEAKMRKDMEELRKREMKQKKREKKIEEREEVRKNKENEHNARIREDYRLNVTVKAQAVEEARLIHKQKKEDAEAAEERKKAERGRLERAREANIAKKELARLAALCA